MTTGQCCANCGEPGHPGHHWMVGVGYVCVTTNPNGEDAPPPDGMEVSVTG